MGKKILVYNNRTHITEALMHLFLPEEMDFCRVSDEAMLREYMKQEQGDMLIIDAFLEQAELTASLALLRELRSISKLPILIVSEPVDEIVKIQALGAGADDFVTTDANPLELMARVKAQLSAYHRLVTMRQNISRIYRMDDLVINDRSRSVTVGTHQVELTPIEYKILCLLLKQKGKIFSAREIYEAIWQAPPIGAENTIPVHIRHIREKIEENPKEPRLLKAVWGIGYKIG